jgi:hypothetical protein
LPPLYPFEYIGGCLFAGITISHSETNDKIKPPFQNFSLTCTTQMSSNTNNSLPPLREVLPTRNDKFEQQEQRFAMSFVKYQKKEISLFKKL